jgi:hypothetical protein
MRMQVFQRHWKSVFVRDTKRSRSVNVSSLPFCIRRWFSCSLITDPTQYALNLRKNDKCGGLSFLDPERKPGSPPRRPGFDPGSVWDLWWTKWHWDRFFPEYFGFPLSVSFHRCSITWKSEKIILFLFIFIVVLHNKPSRLRCVRSICCGALHHKRHRLYIWLMDSGLQLKHVRRKWLLRSTSLLKACRLVSKLNSNVDNTGMKRGGSWGRIGKLFEVAWEDVIAIRSVSVKWSLWINDRYSERRNGTSS